MNIVKKLFIFSFAILLGFNLLTFVAPNLVFAQAPSQDQGLVPCGSFSDNPCQLIDLFRLVIVITNFLIEMAGIVAVVVIIFAGYSLVVAAGNIEAVTEAKKLLVGAFIGFFFVLASMVLANFLIFGGREIIPGTHVIRGEKASITKCPIAYIMQNDTCGDLTSPGGNNNAPVNNTPANNTQLPFQMPPGRGQGLTVADLEVPKLNLEYCDSQQTALLDAVFSFTLKTALAQSSSEPTNCGNIQAGFLAGKRHKILNFEPLIQQDINMTLGNKSNPSCTTVADSGCGVISVMHALKELVRKGYNQPGTWIQAWQRDGSLSSNYAELYSIDFWVAMMKGSNGYFACTSDAQALNHSGPSDIFQNGQMLQGITASQSSSGSSAQLLEDIKSALNAGGVAVVLVKGPPFNTGRGGNHYIMIWKQWQASDNKLWFGVADSNRSAQITQVRYDILQQHLNGVTAIFPSQ